MRIDTSIDGPADDGTLRAAVEERLRWALGSHSADVRRIAVKLKPMEGGAECRMRVHLRDRRTLTVTGTGRDAEDAVATASARAGAAVARTIDTDRLLGI
ncbi:MAG: hypothetical protein ACFCGT_01090 [Sandaracinaceae bacterium]